MLGKRGSFAVFVILLFLLTPANANADLVDWFSGDHFDDGAGNSGDRDSDYSREDSGNKITGYGFFDWLKGLFGQETVGRLSDGQTDDLPGGGDSNSLSGSTLTEEYCELHFYEDNRCGEMYPNLAAGGSGPGGDGGVQTQPMNEAPSSPNTPSPSEKPAGTSGVQSPSSDAPTGSALPPGVDYATVQLADLNRDGYVDEADISEYSNSFSNPADINGNGDTSDDFFILSDIVNFYNGRPYTSVAVSPPPAVQPSAQPPAQPATQPNTQPAAQPATSNVAELTPNDLAGVVITDARFETSRGVIVVFQDSMNAQKLVGGSASKPGGVSSNVNTGGGTGGNDGTSNVPPVAETEDLSGLVVANRITGSGVLDTIKGFFSKIKKFLGFEARGVRVGELKRIYYAIFRDGSQIGWVGSDECQLSGGAYTCTYVDDVQQGDADVTFSYSIRSCLVRDVSQCSSSSSQTRSVSVAKKPAGQQPPGGGAQPPAAAEVKPESVTYDLAMVKKADYNGDKKITLEDYQDGFAPKYGAAEADLNGDGKSDMTDNAIITKMYQQGATLIYTADMVKKADFDKNNKITNEDFSGGGEGSNSFALKFGTAEADLNGDGASNEVDTVLIMKMIEDGAVTAAACTPKAALSGEALLNNLDKAEPKGKIDNEDFNVFAAVPFDADGDGCVELTKDAAVFTAAFGKTYVVAGAAVLKADASATILTGTVGQKVTLDGSRSTGKGANGKPLNHAWSQLGNPAADMKVTFAEGSAQAVVTFTPSKAGDYLFRLTVFDSTSVTPIIKSTADVTIKVAAASAANQKPVANAGADFTMKVGESKQLNGAGSKDPDAKTGETLKHSWGVAQGPTGYTFTGDTTPTPSFKPTQEGGYEFVLVVTDVQGASSDADSVVVKVEKVVAGPNRAPVIAASVGDISLSDVLGYTIVLQGIATDADGDSLTYTWEKGAGVVVADGVFTPDADMSNNGKAAFKPAQAVTNKEFKLNVADGRGGSASKTIKVSFAVKTPTVAAVKPLAAITLIQPFGFVNEEIALDGSNSKGAGSYLWKKKSGPGELTFTAGDKDKTNVKASKEGAYEVELVVTAGVETSVARATVNVFPALPVRGSGEFTKAELERFDVANTGESAGKINHDDFFVVALAFGTKTGDKDYNSKADFTTNFVSGQQGFLKSDGKVDFEDFYAFADAFNLNVEEHAIDKDLTQKLVLGESEFKGQVISDVKGLPVRIVLYWNNVRLKPAGNQATTQAVSEITGFGVWDWIKGLFGGEARGVKIRQDVDVEVYYFIKITPAGEAAAAREVMVREYKQADGNGCKDGACEYSHVPVVAGKTYAYEIKTCTAYEQKGSVIEGKECTGYFASTSVRVPEVKVEYTCGGTLPAEGALCGGDGIGLEKQENYGLVPACTAEKKCEYVCREGYEIKGGKCEPKPLPVAQCKGVVPSATTASLCSGDNAGLTADVTISFVETGQCTAAKCEYHCASGYKVNAGKTGCELKTTPPTPPPAKPTALISGYGRVEFVGKKIILDGSLSQGAGLTYAWKVIDKPAKATVNLGGLTNPMLEFTPLKDGDSGIYQFELRVSNAGGQSEPVLATVIVFPELPTRGAGEFTKAELQRFDLDAVNSPGVIDREDFFVFALAFGGCSPTRADKKNCLAGVAWDARADFTTNFVQGQPDFLKPDGKVDFEDFFAFAAAYNKIVEVDGIDVISKVSTTGIALQGIQIYDSVAKNYGVRLVWNQVYVDPASLPTGKVIVNRITGFGVWEGIKGFFAKIFGQEARGIQIRKDVSREVIYFISVQGREQSIKISEKVACAVEGKACEITDKGVDGKGLTAGSTYSYSIKACFDMEGKECTASFSTIQVKVEEVKAIVVSGRPGYDASCLNPVLIKPEDKKVGDAGVYATGVKACESTTANKFCSKVQIWGRDIAASNAAGKDVFMQKWVDATKDQSGQDLTPCTFSPTLFPQYAFVACCQASAPPPPPGPGENKLPVAVTSGQGIVLVGKETTLWTTNSKDEDGRITNYLWEQVGEQPAKVSITAASSDKGDQAKFTPQVKGTYQFKLVVTDDKGGKSAAATLKVFVHVLPDAGNDGCVDYCDYVRFAKTFDKKTGEQGFDAGFDFDADGEVDITDDGVGFFLPLYGQQSSCAAVQDALKKAGKHETADVAKPDVSVAKTNTQCAVTPPPPPLGPPTETCLNPALIQRVNNQGVIKDAESGAAVCGVRTDTLKKCASLQRKLSANEDNWETITTATCETPQASLSKDFAMRACCVAYPADEIVVEHVNPEIFYQLAEDQIITVKVTNGAEYVDKMKFRFFASFGKIDLSTAGGANYLDQRDFIAGTGGGIYTYDLQRANNPFIYYYIEVFKKGVTSPVKTFGSPALPFMVMNLPDAPADYDKKFDLVLDGCVDKADEDAYAALLLPAQTNESKKIDLDGDGKKDENDKKFFSRYLRKHGVTAQQKLCKCKVAEQCLDLAGDACLNPNQASADKKKVCSVAKKAKACGAEDDYEITIAGSSYCCSAGGWVAGRCTSVPNPVAKLVKQEHGFKGVAGKNRLRFDRTGFEIELGLKGVSEGGVTTVLYGKDAQPAEKTPAETGVTKKAMKYVQVLVEDGRLETGDPQLFDEVNITFTYVDGEITALGLSEPSLQIYWFNTTTKKWDALPSKVDVASNTVNATMVHLSIFGLFGDQTSAPGVTPPPAQPPAQPTGGQVDSPGGGGGGGGGGGRAGFIAMQKGGQCVRISVGDQKFFEAQGYVKVASCTAAPGVTIPPTLAPRPTLPTLPPGPGVRPTLPAAGEDSDGDGLVDSWERNFFGGLGQGLEDDYDGDGFSNGEEYSLNADPTDAASPGKKAAGWVWIVVGIVVIGGAVFLIILLKRKGRRRIVDAPAHKQQEEDDFLRVIKSASEKHEGEKEDEKVEVNPKILDYVQKARKAGYDDGTIKNNLLQVGWARKQVEVALK